jgi:hypothetical protein
MFLGLLDPDPDPSVRGMNPDPDPIWILLSPSKKSKKNLDSYCFVTFFFDFLSAKIMYMYLQKVISKKTSKKLVFCWHLGKVNDENGRIRIH